MPAANEHLAILKPRIGVVRGEFAVPDSFFDPLPDEILDGFCGGSPAQRSGNRDPSSLS